MTGRHLRRSAMRIAAALLSCVVVACSIPTDGAPRIIPEEERVDLVELETGDPATGSSLIYLLAPTQPDDQQHLRAVQRDVERSPRALLESLFLGPNTSEIAEGVGTAVPADVELLSARTVRAVLTIDVSDSFRTLTVDAVTLAVAQIVSTVTELDSVRAVRLLVNGEEQVWPVGNGGLASRPLTAYDYPGFVESSQPAYPAIPSGDA